MSSIDQLLLDESASSDAEVLDQTDARQLVYVTLDTTWINSVLLIKYVIGDEDTRLREEEIAYHPTRY